MDVLNGFTLIWNSHDEFEVVLNNEVQLKITFFKTNQYDYREKKPNENRDKNDYQ